MSEGWHGRLDVIMDEVPVVITGEEDLTDSPVYGNNASIENKSSKELLPTCCRQIRSKAIVYSFWQQKQHPDLENFLIPTIAMSKEQMAFCFYDCENDLLLETPPIYLFDESKVHLRRASILALWLVLNFKYFSSGVPLKLQKSKYSAGFFSQVGSLLDNYRNNVESPCHGTTERWWGIDIILDSDQESDQSD